MQGGRFFLINRLPDKAMIMVERVEGKIGTWYELFDGKATTFVGTSQNASQI